MAKTRHLFTLLLLCFLCQFSCRADAADTVPPTVPTGAIATAMGCAQINLAWNASTDPCGSGIAGYKIYKNTAFLKQVTTTSTSDAGLTASTSYSYTVSAVDNATNESAQSPAASATTTACAVGSFLWVKAIGGTGSDVGEAVAIDSSGNRIVIGEFQGTVNFGAGALISAGGTDIFVAKYSSTGVLAWAQRFGGTGDDAARSVAVDSSGNIVVAGSFSGTANFGSGALTSAGGTDIFVAKYSSAGTPAWSLRFGSTSDDAATGVAVDTSGNILLTGFFTGTVNFGGGARTGCSCVVGGTPHVFLAKYNAAGTHVWSKGMAGDSTATAMGVAVDGSSNVAITGSFRGSISFGGGAMTSAGLADVFVAKFNAVGTLLWQQRYGGTDQDEGTGIAMESAGNVGLVGYFRVAADFGGGTLTSAGGSDVFLGKYASADGAYIWAQRFGGTSDDSGAGVAMDGSGNILATGLFQGAADFGGATLTSAGIIDTFVGKYAAANGARLWAKRFGGVTNDAGNNVTVDSTGVTATGYFSGNVDFGGGPVTSAGGTDIFLLTLVP